jgi:hypothetical protein
MIRVSSSPQLLDLRRANRLWGLAVTRGLLLDLLLTGDRTAVDGAMELFGSIVAEALPSTVDRQH